MIVKMSEIKSDEPQSTTQDRQVGLRMSEDTYRLVQDIIIPFYRSPTINHAMRLLIEDSAEMIRSGGWLEQPALKKTLVADSTIEAK